MELESQKDQHIVGSAEPLDAEETRERLRELEAWGVDLTLVRASLNRTPDERVDRMLGLLELAEEMRRSYAAKLSRSDLQNKVQEYNV